MKKKPVLCRSWTVHGSCARGDECTFAHGAAELQRLASDIPLVAPKVVEIEEPAPPGTDDAAALATPPLDYFDHAAPYEVAFGAEEEKTPQEWRKVDHNGVEYWYNEATGATQWEDPHREPPVEEVEVRDGHSICEPVGDGVLLRVIIKPGQPEDNVLDVTTSCVKVSLRAPIEDRWCNQALLAFCRRALHVPQRERNNVKIADGDESLDKIVHIPALTPKEVIKRLHKKKDFEVDTNDVDKWLRHTERKQKEEERRMKRRKWA